MREGRTRARFGTFEGVVNKRYSSGTLSNIEIAVFLEYANTIIHTNVPINYRIFIKDMQMLVVSSGVAQRPPVGVVGP